MRWREVEPIGLSFCLAWLVILAVLFAVVAWRDRDKLVIAIGTVFSVLSIVAAIPVWHLLHV